MWAFVFTIQLETGGVFYLGSFFLIIIKKRTNICKKQNKKHFGVGAKKPQIPGMESFTTFKLTSSDNVAGKPDISLRRPKTEPREDDYWTHSNQVQQLNLKMCSQLVPAAPKHQLICLSCPRGFVSCSQSAADTSRAPAGQDGRPRVSGVSRHRQATPQADLETSRLHPAAGYQRGKWRQHHTGELWAPAQIILWCEWCRTKINLHLFSQWPAIHPEDSGVYICQGVNNEGVTEVKVEIVVEGGLGAPVASVGATEMTVVEGHTVTMECQASGKMCVCVCVCVCVSTSVLPLLLTFHFVLSHSVFSLPGSPPPVITWSKLRAPLPWKHTVANGVLTLTSVGRQDSGQYICNATNMHGYSEAYVQMEVESESTAHMILWRLC